MRRDRIRTHFDVVPMINVSLVIVLTLMIISPFLAESKVKVNLPQAATSEVKDQDKVEVTLSLEGLLAIGEEEVSQDQLATMLQNQFRLNPGLMAVIKADKSLPYERVEEVMAIVQEAGAQRIAIATEQRRRTTR